MSKKGRITAKSYLQKILITAKKRLVDRPKDKNLQKKIEGLESAIISIADEGDDENVGKKI